nr:MAG TPA: hypothetical protein [Caudoviricetes sp.]
MLKSSISKFLIRASYSKKFPVKETLITAVLQIFRSLHYL